MNNSSPDSTQINTKFYQEVFTVWNQSEDYFWPGFWDLYPYLSELFKDKKTANILDIGCANGRWFNFLEYVFPEIVFTKVGVDFIDFPFVNKFNFVKLDISSPAFTNWQIQDKMEFDLITMFGVYHHIQGGEIRDSITKKVSQMLAENGLFVFTRWNFLFLPRLRNHILTPQDLKERGESNLLNLKVWEKGDYLLKWDKGVKGVRLANMLDSVEIGQMLEKNGLKCVLSYDSDDKKEDRNTYFLNKKLLGKCLTN